MINNRSMNIPPTMRHATEKVLQKAAANTNSTGETSSTESLEQALPRLKSMVESDPALRISLKDVMKSLESFQQDLRKNTTEVSPVYKAATTAAVLGALGLTISQGVRAYNDVQNGQSDGQFVTLFSAQGAKIAAVLTTLLKPNANNSETNYNLFRFYGLPNAVASTSFEYIKNQPVAIAATVAGTIAGFHSLELNDWMRNAPHRQPAPIVERHANSAQAPNGRADIESGSPLESMEGYKLLQNIVSAATEDIKSADALVTAMVGGLRPSGEQVDRVGTAELNILESSHRIISDKVQHLTSQAGLPKEQASSSSMEKAKSSYFVALQQLIGYTSVALSKSPTDKFSSLADVASAGSLMAAKTISGATGQAIQQLFKDLMSLTTLWLPIQAANAIHAQNAQDGIGFLDKHETHNIMLSIAALSTAMLTIAGPVSKLGADTLGVPINAASQAYQKFFGKPPEPEPTQNSGVADHSANAAAQAAVAEQSSSPADSTVVEIEPETTAVQSNSSQSRGLAASIVSIGQHLSNVKDSFTSYMQETFAAKNIEVVAIKPAVGDKDLERDRKALLNDLNFDDVQGYVDLIKYLTSGQPESDLQFAPLPHDNPLDSEQRALVDAAIQHALRTEEEASSSGISELKKSV